MSLHSKVSGSWREVCNAHVKVNGVWRQVEQIYTKVNGVWKPVWTYGITTNAEIPAYACTNSYDIDHHWGSTSELHIIGTASSSYNVVPGTTATITYNVSLGGEYYYSEIGNESSYSWTYHCKGAVKCIFSGATIASYTQNINKTNSSGRVIATATATKGDNWLTLQSNYVDNKDYGDSQLYGTCTVTLNITSDTLTIKHSGTGDFWGMFVIRGTMAYTTPGA